MALVNRRCYGGTFDAPSYYVTILHDIMLDIDTQLLVMRQYAKYTFTVNSLDHLAPWVLELLTCIFTVTGKLPVRS